MWYSFYTLISLEAYRAFDWVFGCISQLDFLLELELRASFVLGILLVFLSKSRDCRAANTFRQYIYILRKPADRLGKVVFANEVSIGGVGGGA